MKTTDTHVFRVKPDTELTGEIKNYCLRNNITSAVIPSLIGSLKTVELGFLKELPGKYDSVTFSGPLEIVTAQGTVALCDDELVVHLHIVVSNEQKAVGGHLVKGQIFSTAEVVIQQLNQQLNRKTDEYTGLKELV